MKTAYGDYVFWSNSEVVNLLGDNFKKFHDTVPKWLKTQGVPDEEINYRMGCVWMKITLEREVRSGNCTHLFFTGDKMEEWLEGCATGMSAEQCSMIENYGAEAEHDDVFIQKAKSKVFMLHFKGGGSQVYLCGFAGRIKLEEGGEVYNGWLLACTTKNSESVFTYGRVEHLNNTEWVRRRNLISSALAYMKCFPDTIRDGIPSDLKHPNHFKGETTRSVSMCHSLIVRDGPNPHYRSGHFRLLSSPRFTHKQGEVVFVHGTFIKGKAKTVLSPEEVPA